MNNRKKFNVRVSKKWLEADDIYAYELVGEGGNSLPPFTAGAHIDVFLGDKLCRQYSLCNNPAQTDRYMIAVLKESNSRGGSRAMHEQVNEGQIITISEPKNHFSLDRRVMEGEKKPLLVGGGIGITPLLSMAQYLKSQSLEFAFYYYGRSRSKMAFLNSKIYDFKSERSAVFFDDESSLSFDEIIASYNYKEYVIYTCGPEGFINAVSAVAKNLGWNEKDIFFERFSAPIQNIENIDTIQKVDKGFYVDLIKSNRQLYIPKNKKILEVLLENGIEIVTSCEQGICGSCVTEVISGEPDHRDYYLSEKEKEHKKQIMICCSRSKSDVLKLNI